MTADFCRLTTAKTGFCAAVLLVAGCATAPAPDGALIADPYEETNRFVHDINKDIDTVFLRPVAEGYGLFTPTLIQHMIANGLHHLRLPAVFINRALQGDLEEAGAALARFSLNTIIGAGGLLDPAAEMGLPYTPSDFGVTLAVWGANEGVYHEIPFFGPQTTRDVAGKIGGFLVDPTILITFGVIDVSGVVTAVDYTRTALAPVNGRHENAELIDQLLYETEDSYIAVRTGYVQSRRFEVSGEASNDLLPDIFGD
ncbi:MAG: VacJ family lipoprotein [Paracoccaceae bacterium]